MHVVIASKNKILQFEIILWTNQDNNMFHYFDEISTEDD